MLFTLGNPRVYHSDHPPFELRGKGKGVDGQTAAGDASLNWARARSCAAVRVSRVSRVLMAPPTWSGVGASTDGGKPKKRSQKTMKSDRRSFLKTSMAAGLG